MVNILTTQSHLGAFFYFGLRNVEKRHAMYVSQFEEKWCISSTIMLEGILWQVGCLLNVAVAFETHNKQKLYGIYFFIPRHV